jgi:23S rRNA (adenine-N6)-dimethyltransferase
VRLFRAHERTADISRHQGNLWRTQNILRDPALIERLVGRSGIGADDVVYDLGAGTGNLTAALARHAARVVAIERDPVLVTRLRARFAATPSVVVRHADIFRYPMPHAEHVVFANPPFDRTADLVRRLTDADVPPRIAYLVLQRAAAERFLGRPRGTLVAALLAPWFALRIEHRFAPSDFAPQPAVDIVLVRLEKRAPPHVPSRDASLYRDLVVTCFVNPRSLLDARVTPQTVTFAEWLDLYRRFRTLPRAVRRSVAGAEARLRLQQRSLSKTHRTRAPRDALSSVALRRGFRRREERVRVARDLADDVARGLDVVDEPRRLTRPQRCEIDLAFERPIRHGGAVPPDLEFRAVGTCLPPDGRPFART